MFSFTSEPQRTFGRGISIACCCC